MFKRRLNSADYFLIAANLVPVAGVWFFGWNAMEIFTVYCLETIIIGFYNLVKMGIITVHRRYHTWYGQGKVMPVSGLFFMLFFVIHYGIFVVVQMGIFFGVSGIGGYYDINLFNFIFKWPRIISADSVWLLAAFFVGYGYETIRHFLLSGQYRTISMTVQMFQPYLRIFIQQVAVIFGSIFLVFGAGQIFISIFALVRIVIELTVNYSAWLNMLDTILKRRSLRNPAAAGPEPPDDREVR